MLVLSDLVFPLLLDRDVTRNKAISILLYRVVQAFSLVIINKSTEK
jgi:hypothetical protein